MSQEAEADRRQIRRRLVPFWVPLMLGFLALFNVIGNPRVAALHGSDVVQLIAVGL